MVSIGQGAQASVQAQIESIGTNLLFVSAGAQNVGGVRSGTGDSGTNTLTVEDLDAIKREVPSVAMVTPAVNARSQLVSGNMNWNTSVQGVSEQYPEIRKWTVQSGSFFTDVDVRTAGRVIVIGQTIADNLFSGMDPVGQTLRVANLPFRVVGVMVRKGQDQQDEIRTISPLLPTPPCKRRFSAARGCKWPTPQQFLRMQLTQPSSRSRTCCGSGTN